MSQAPPEESPGSEFLARTTGSNAVGGLLWTLLSNLTAPLLLLTTSVVAARFLGPTGMGQQSFIAFASLSLGLALSSGMSSALYRYVGTSIGMGRGAALRGALRRVWVLQSVAAVADFAGLAAIGLTHTNSTIRLAWILSAATSGLTVLQTVPSAILIGAQRWRQAGVIGLLTGVVATAATAAVLAAGWGIPGMFGVELIAVAVNVGWVLARSRATVRELIPTVGDPEELTGEILRFAGLATAQTLLAYVVWQRSEFFFLSRYTVAAQIAVFSIAYASATAVQRVLEGITAVLHPVLAAMLGAGQHERIRVAVGRAARLVLLATPPIIGGLLAVGPEALRLIYGDAYRQTGPVLVILAAVIPLVIVARVGASILNVLRRLWVLMGCLAVATVVDIALCLALIPRHAALGAAVANTAAQAVAAVLEIIAAVRIVGPVEWRFPAITRGLLATGVSAAAAVVAVRVVGGVAGVAAGVVAGTAAYAVAAVLVRPFPSTDLDWLEAAAGDRLGGLVRRVCHLARWAARPAPPPVIAVPPEA
ncbi:MAG TPA: lipopolysaccharide biosynthesis protein [Mycobacteriales bacterium]|nr:lipopolysaccharide biosynthesis protein [Mycobacteriales bacterium]